MIEFTIKHVVDIIIVTAFLHNVIEAMRKLKL